MVRWWERVVLVMSGLGAVAVAANAVPTIEFLRWTWLRVLIVLAFGFQAYSVGVLRTQRSTAD